MSQSNAVLKMHKEQEETATLVMQEYKIEICKLFFQKFGKSYHKYEDHIETWRTDPAYGHTHEREQYLIEQTLYFIAKLPIDKPVYNNPRFLKSITSQMAEHLSTYCCRKVTEGKVNRNEFTKALQEIFFDNNQYVQRKVASFTHASERAWGLTRKAKREERKLAKETAKQEKKHRKTIGESRRLAVLVISSPNEEEEKIRQAKTAKIRKMHKEIDKLKVQMGHTPNTL